ncbi:Gfo/Idh/MocA family protein [Cephaloticoccus capnophilus]|uniref:Gfo/Idh/MocA family protein n=1 Tax=Cephaloticoccus capnophilus TaxID=1548208 RepID=UPI000A96AC3B|nr:Gfo/Idh/MocA family oxidoreductase [Cephaloticoccus capnophilus]
MSKPVKILMVGAGGQGKGHSARYQQMPGVEVVAAVDVQAELLAAFAKEYKIPNTFSSVEEAIAWGQFDAVSNVTPDRFHYPTTLPLLAAGKHVLCEKPLATNAADAVKMAEAAAKAGVVNAVNFSYRSGGAMQKAAELVRSGLIGEVRFFEASYLQSWLHQPAWGEWTTTPQWLWRLSSAHGSKGALGDVGVHIVDFATYVMDLPVADVSCRFALHNKAPGNKIGEYVLDANDSATMQVSLANGALGTISQTRVASGHLNDLRLKAYGTKGALEVSTSGELGTLTACLEADLEKPKWQSIEVAPVTDNQARFIAAIRGEDGPRAPDFARGAEIQKVLDAAEESAAQRGITINL